MSLAYFPLYADDYEADTAHLSLAEDGAYNRLLRLCWRTPGCSIPSDRAWIYRRMRAHSDDERAVVDIVIHEFFDEADGRLSNARLSKEWLAAKEAHEKRRRAGSKGGKAKTLKTNDQEPSNAKAKLKQPEPEPYLSEDKPSDRGARKRAARLPENWTLPAEWIEDATAVGLTVEQAYDQAERMRDWSRSAKAGAKLDWRAIWRNWCKRVADDRAKPGGNGNYADRQRANADAHQSASLRLIARHMAGERDSGQGGACDGSAGFGGFANPGGYAYGVEPDRTTIEALPAPNPKRARG